MLGRAVVEIGFPPPEAEDVVEPSDEGVDLRSDEVVPMALLGSYMLG
jgi:hypothetical protein